MTAVPGPWVGTREVRPAQGEEARERFPVDGHRL